MANAGASVIQSTQYYPFGMAFAEGTTTEQGKQPYKYNSKELNQSHGLNQYDYSARYYDPANGRFTTPDPLSEKFYNWSPYVYVMNNPMRFIDKDGKAPGDVVVTFGGADIMNNKGKGLASNIINSINQNLFSKEGGSAQAFSSQYWGTNIRSSGDLDKATQAAYDYITDNYNINNGEAVEGGRIVIEGYSFGGILASHLSKRLDKNGVSVELLITIDAAAGPSSAFVDRTVSPNVKENQNFYQTTRSTVLSRGKENKAVNATKTSVVNTDMSKNSNHSSIDDNTLDNIIQMITKKLKTNENKK